MGATENIETVKAIYDAFGRGDVAAILERCTDDVGVMLVSASSSP